MIAKVDYWISLIVYAVSPLRRTDDKIMVLDGVFIGTLSITFASQQLVHKFLSYLYLPHFRQDIQDYFHHILI